MQQERFSDASLTLTLTLTPNRNPNRNSNRNRNPIQNALVYISFCVARKKSENRALGHDS